MRITEPYIIFPRKLKSGRVVYYYQFRDEEGKRSAAYSTGTDKLSQAKRICQKMYNQGQFVKHNGLTFKSFANGFFDDDSDWCKWRKVNDSTLAASTIHSYRQILQNRIMPYFENIELKKINTDIVKKWIVWLSEKASAKSTNNAQSVLNIILKSAKEKKLIKELPTAGLSFRKIKKKDRQLLSLTELNQIYHSPLWYSQSVKNAFLLCCLTGMRIGEVTGLQTVDISENYINVQHSLHPDFGLGQTKTRVCRYVPIPSELNLKSLCGEVWAFPRTDKKEPVNEKTVYSNFTKICDSLNIERKERGITVHSLRNFFISYARGNTQGTDIEAKIKAVVGHADETQTDWYTYWTPDMFIEIYKLQSQLYKEITKGA